MSQYPRSAVLSEMISGTLIGVKHNKLLSILLVFCSLVKPGRLFLMAYLCFMRAICVRVGGVVIQTEIVLITDLQMPHVKPLHGNYRI